MSQLTVGATLRDYLRFLRVDSAAASMAFAVLGYILAGGTLFSPLWFAWMLFGLLFHAAGYADNNIQDYLYDLDDVNKSGFPLGKSIALSRARAATIVLHSAGLVSAWFLAGSPAAFASFILIYLLGLTYNRRNKAWRTAPLFFSLTFALLAFFSFFSTSHAVSGVIVAVCFLSFVEGVFQNAVGTSLKDVDSDRSSLMKSLGARVVDGRLKVPPRAFYIGFGLKVVGLFPLAYLALSSGNETYLAAIPLTGISIYSALVLLRGGRWERSGLMLRAAVSELGVYYSVVAIFSLQFGATGTAFMMLFPLVWYVLLKKALWGTVLELKA
ncbi:MAG: UbiA family prenyltransferase [Thaumarchaeota archaeon]|nr:UbiA family prenyltransferase [Nitrososphaerota archaeon]